MPRRAILIAGAAVLIALVVAGVVLWNHRAARAAVGGRARPAPVPVRVITPSKGGLERTVTRPGTVHSFQYAQLFAKVDGYLYNQTVDIGDRVKKDQVLAGIDAPERVSDVAQASAALKKAKAQVQVMDARVSAAKAEVQQSKVKVEQAEANLLDAAAMVKLRSEQYQRIKRLVESRSVEQELADEKREAQTAAESHERAQRKAVETAKVAVATAQAQFTAAQADLADAKAQVNVAAAARARARVFLAYTNIRAPFDGVITRRSYHEGDYIRAGSPTGDPPVLTIARTDLMRVIVDVPDPDVPYTHRGEAADVRIDSLPGRVFTCKVARTALSEEHSSRTMRTEVDLPNPQDLLKDGMFGSVTIHLGANPNALTIPTACLVGPARDDQRAVYVVRDGNAHRVLVHVRRDDGIHAEIESGLDPDAQVVESHGPGLRDGAPVAVQGP